MAFESIMTGVEPVLRLYLDTKFGLEQSIPFDADWLHLLVGPAIFVAAALVFRRPSPAWGPWLVVVGLAIFNEVIDLAGVRLDRAPDQLSYYSESVSDFLLTVAIPTLLLLFSCFAPRRYEALGLASEVRR